MKCNPLDCKQRGSDNGKGDLPFIARMKIKFLKSVVLENKRRCGVALLAFVCSIWFAVAPGGAQSPNQKRITALQLVAAAEGSRVTIVSDSALNDYEAFRRGDRFYVKIPLAESTSALPHCCGDGFEDVQVQKVGDSLIVSFKLQPGAFARVDQRSNRLDVIFSAPNKSLRNTTAKAVKSRMATGTSVSQISQGRGPAAAGPEPPASARTFRERVVTAGARAANESRARQNPVQINPHADSSNGANNQLTSGNNQAPPRDAAINAPSSSASPSAILTPSPAASYPELTTATPAKPLSSKPTLSSSGISESPSFLNWKTRGKTAVQWVSANRQATLLGALILLTLLLYLAMALRRRRNVRSKRVNMPKVQPKLQPHHSSGAPFDDVVSADPVTPPASRNLPKDFVWEPAITPAGGAVATQNHAWGLTKPSIASPANGHSEDRREEEEREVFEL